MGRRRNLIFFFIFSNFSVDFNMDATAFVLQSRSHRQSIETTDIVRYLFDS
jgi:hypothetical protein